MRFKDTSRWIWREMRESKAFTSLNIMGVTLNVSLMVIFLALVAGLELTTIRQMTKNISMYNLEVLPLKPKGFTDKDLTRWQQDPRLKQVIPVLAQHAELQVQSLAVGVETEEPVNVPVYTENIWLNDQYQEDLRTTPLRFPTGRMLEIEDQASIVVSAAIFRELAAEYSTLTPETIDQHRFEIVVERNNSQGKEIKAFPCVIVGIAEQMLYRNGMVYVSMDLAQAMDRWNSPNRSTTGSMQAQAYDRLDLVTENLSALEPVRQDVQKLGYRTSSILDKIDNARSVLFLVKVAFFLLLSISILIASFNLAITLTSYVLKRRHDIGVLKALGANDWQVEKIFVWHATYLSGAGVLFGIMVALLLIQVVQGILSQYISLQEFTLFVVDIKTLGFIIVGAIAMSVVTSFFPARKAAAITPAESLRHE